MSVLQISHFSKDYNGKKAVEDLSLEIQAGEIYGFIGHNGAGKTTTIKAVAGILPFTQGEILVDGVSVRQDPIACKRKIAYIPDNPDLYEFLSGVKYLNFIADIFRVPKDQREERIHRYAEVFGMTEDLGSSIGAYSHGMKQKLSLIAALIHEPKLMLLDEPFVGLDPKAAHDLKQIMRRLCDEGGAIFFSTHVLEVAEKLCDKVAIIKSGRLAASGSMDQVRGDGVFVRRYVLCAGFPAPGPGAFLACLGVRRLFFGGPVLYHDGVFHSVPDFPSQGQRPAFVPSADGGTDCGQPPAQYAGAGISL